MDHAEVRTDMYARARSSENVAQARDSVGVRIVIAKQAAKPNSVTTLTVLFHQTAPVVVLTHTPVLAVRLAIVSRIVGSVAIVLDTVRLGVRTVWYVYRRQ
jgi:hypothetical protein